MSVVLVKCLFWRGVAFSVPRWFLVGGGARSPSGLVGFSVRVLGLCGCVFLPFGVGCTWDREGRSIVCGYDELARHVRLAGELFVRYGDLVRFVAIHTEYQAPIWFDEVFVENYSRFTLDLVGLAVEKCGGLRVVEVELHPGFSDLRGSRRPWGSIVEGMVGYLLRVYDVLREHGLVFRVTVENRGSSVLRKPQAAADLYELLRFRRELEERLRREGVGVEVGLTIDPLQLLSLKRRRVRDRRRALEEALRESELLAKDHGKHVHSVHVHWVSEKGKTHAPPPPSEVGVAVERFKRIIGCVVGASGRAYVVPEIAPMYLRRPETQQFLEELAKALNTAP